MIEGVIGFIAGFLVGEATSQDEERSYWLARREDRACLELMRLRAELPSKEAQEEILGVVDAVPSMAEEAYQMVMLEAKRCDVSELSLKLGQRVASQA